MVPIRVWRDHPSHVITRGSGDCRRPRATSASRLTTAALLCALAGLPRAGVAQEADPLPYPPDTSARFPNTTAGEFTPSAGFDIIKTKRGTLNISVYGLFRWVNQIPAGQDSFVDHRGVVRSIRPRNDVNWHRTMIWVNGWFYNPKFRYTITSWGLATTQQTLLFGNLQYRANKHFTVGVGIAPTLTARSLQGSWPYWAASDRQMAEEFFRGGFSSGVWITGEVVPRLWYTLSLNNNISQLGVTQANDTPDMFWSGSLRWQPTTGEFGPRNGFGDFEYHTRVATQFGLSTGRARESRYAPTLQPPNATQIKLSDGVNVFETGALADFVTVNSLNYNVLAVDAGVKYRGFSFQSEYYWRVLDNFVADGFVPNTSIYDHGFLVQMMYMAIPKTLGVYAVGGYVRDEFKRRPYEAGGGLSWYPAQSRSWRVNLHALHVERSPASSFFGYYQAGQTGTVLSLGSDVLF
jgi:hypothetical protein